MKKITKPVIELSQLKEWKDKEFKLSKAKRNAKSLKEDLKAARKAAAGISSLEKKVAAAEKRLALCDSAVKKDKEKAKKGTLPQNVHCWQAPDWLEARIMKQHQPRRSNDRSTVDNP